MNRVKEFKISISLGFVLYSFVAVSAWVFSDEILKRKAHEFKIGGFWKVDQTSQKIVTTVTADHTPCL